MINLLVTLSCFLAFVLAAALIWGLCVAAAPAPTEADKERWFR